MSQKTTQVIEDRFIFHWNLSGISACLAMLAFFPFAWHRDGLDYWTKISIEVFCCTYLAMDAYLYRSEFSRVINHHLLKFAIILALVPWYTLFTQVFQQFFKTGNEAMILFLTHASYLPYLFIRFQLHGREHIAPKVIKATVVLVVTFFCLHLLACAWMIIKPRSNVDFLTEYSMALYFVMTTVTTVGYGDITPSDNLGRAFAMGLQFLGVCVFGIVIGQVSRLIINADKRKEHLQNQVDSLTSLFKHYEVPQDLQKKSYRFLHHVLTRSSNEDEQKVLGTLPHGLQSEIRVYMNVKPISKVSLFKNCSHACLVETAKELQQIYFIPGQQIFRKGDKGDVMYMIGHGQVKVHIGDQLIATLSDGQVFGEMALVESESRGADVTAISHCDAFILSQDKFHHLMAHHKDLSRNVQEVIRARKAG